MISVDSSASCPCNRMIIFDKKIEDLRLPPRSGPGSEPFVQLTRHGSAVRPTGAPRTTARPAWRSVGVLASLPIALICTGFHSVSEFRRCSQDEWKWTLRQERQAAEAAERASIARPLTFANYNMRRVSEIGHKSVQKKCKHSMVMAEN
jgi:hypothetical protein